MSIFFEDGKPYISVIAFVQANLTLSSCFNYLDKTNSWKFFNSFDLNYFDLWKVSSIGLQVCECKLEACAKNLRDRYNFFREIQ